jgi:hypothetical protein
VGHIARRYCEPPIGLASQDDNPVSLGPDRLKVLLLGHSSPRATSPMRCITTKHREWTDSPGGLDWKRVPANPMGLAADLCCLTASGKKSLVTPDKSEKPGRAL